MYKIISADTLELRLGRTVKFEGASHGVDASFFHVKSHPGTGSLLHKHPYPETWLVRSGRAQFTVGDDQIEAGAGEIVIAAPNIPHKFLNVGDGLLEMFCVHTSSSIVQELVSESS
jgi:mannose-6-phosphate isomerase-like protein (cupin superfamily)